LVRVAIEQIRCKTNPNRWQAFWRSEIKGEDVADVARELGMSQGAVHMACYNLKKRIGERLTELAQEDPEDVKERCP
jgi:RNA polymerase sigma-70 factor (ECF subfamily)